MKLSRTRYMDIMGNAYDKAAERVEAGNQGNIIRKQKGEKEKKKIKRIKRREKTREHHNYNLHMTSKSG